MITRSLLPALALCAALSPSPGAGAFPANRDRLEADEAAVARNIKELWSSSSVTRDAAARSLRAIIARYPSGTTDLRRPDGGRAYWEARLAMIKPGMKEADVIRILGHTVGMTGSGIGHLNMYQLDDNWSVTIHVRNPDTVLQVDDLKRSASQIHVPFPAGYTGRWVTYFVNGQVASDMTLRQGVYDGTNTAFYDNGRLSYTQHFRDGRPDGTRTHWYPNGQVQLIAHYKLGKQDGAYEVWDENGQRTLVQHFKDGVKDGEEAAWSKEGALQYRWVYVNGKVTGAAPSLAR